MIINLYRGQQDQSDRREINWGGEQWNGCPGTACVRKSPGTIWDRERYYIFNLSFTPQKWVNANGREKPGGGTGKHSKRRKNLLLLGSKPLSRVKWSWSPQSIPPLAAPIGGGAKHCPLALQPGRALPPPIPAHPSGDPRRVPRCRAEPSASLPGQPHKGNSGKKTLNSQIRNLTPAPKPTSSHFHQEHSL